MEKQTSCVNLHAFLLLLLLLLLVHTSLAAAAAAAADAFRCPADQASALLRLKQSFQQPLLPSWRAGTDCCRWEGVSCEATSGRVAALDLSGHGLQSRGGLDDALFKLVSLQRLNLAGNNFSGASLPTSGFERLTELAHLNLSNTGFAGQIPIGVGSLRKLVSLDLSSDGQLSPLLLEFKERSFRSVMGNLNNLRELHLDWVDMSAAAGDWCDVLAESAPRLRVLTLQSCKLSGSICPSLSRLRSLAVVDLSSNQGFSDTSEELFTLSGAIPEFFAEFSSLTILNLSNNDFNGSFPRGIFQLEKLSVLDVSSNSDLSGSLPDLPAGSSLEVLELREINFSGEIPSSISNLKHLKTLDISGSNGRFSAGGLPASISDLTFLSFLDLSSSGFQIGELPAAIGRLQSLSTLRLRQCGISGAIPSSIRNLTRLSELDLSQNNLTGPINFYSEGAFLNLERLQLCCNSLSGPVPGFLFSLPLLEFISLMSNNLAGPLQEFSDPSPSLTSVYLDYNQLNGSIPRSFFKLTSLETLDLSRNSLSGVVQLSFFWRLTNLSNLCLSANRLTVIVDDEHNSSSSTSLPQINSLGLACCNMTKIPSILRYVVVGDLDLSCNQIGGSIPKWIWANQNDNIDVFKFNLSRNKFTSMELSLVNASVYYLDLSYNNLQGPVPISISPQFLDYSNNLFSSIPEDLMARLSSPFYLSLANNTLHGAIPPMICNASNLKFLDLSYNYFSGRVPSCLVDGHLTILKLRHNQFEGTLPDDIKGGCVSQTIDLNGNQMEGQLPRSLSNCNDLEVFDVGDNNFVDSFPSWMGRLPKLRVLVLRSNRFSGPVGAVPVNDDQNRTHFSSLQIIDLASNNFSGSLHLRWFEELKAMMVTRERQALENNLSGKFYRDTVVVVYKGTSMAISRILIAFNVIDFSDNAFISSIPESIGKLASLRGLNMSHNAFTGAIPSQLSDLTQLESLDLSSNQLYGEIPEVFTSLTSLASLNVSYNHLQGSIPQGGQFLTFTNASFEGNAGLCGKPLSKQCNSSNAGGPSLEKEKSSEASVDTIVLFIVVGSGFGLGFAMAILFQVVCKGKRWSWNVRRIA